jgi:ABC-type phosphate transport system substrate-binding protein
MRDFDVSAPARCSRRAGLALLGVGCGSLLTAIGRAASAGEARDFLLIVNPANSLREAPREQVADAFLKKLTRWPDGERIRPVDLRTDNGVRWRFSERVLMRSVGAVRSYWQQRIFSGRDVPPPEVDSDASVIAFVAKVPGAVGYVSAGAKLAGVAELAIR